MVVAEEIIKMLPPSDDYDIVRKSSNYISVVKGDWDVARIKFTDKAKWINVCGVDIGKVKRRIEEPEDVRQFEDDLIKTYEYIMKYS